MASGYSDLSEIRKNDRSFNSYPKPPKINLINEQPRRESVIEQQLASIITRPNYQQQSISHLPPQQQQQQYPYPFQPYQQPQQELQKQQCYPSQQQVCSPSNSQFQDVIPRSHGFSAQEFSSPYSQQGTSTNYTTTIRQQQHPADYGYPYDPMAPGPSGIGSNSQTGYSPNLQQQQHYPEPSSNYTTVTKTVKTTTLAGENLGRHQQQVEHQQLQYTPVPPVRFSGPTTANYSELAAELAEKEAKLKKEIAYMNLHQNQWSRPRQTREPRREPQPKVARSEQRWIKDCTSGSPSLRPTSRASSTRSTTEADLLEKANKLLQDVEELERKPLNKQQILIESGASRTNSAPQNKQDHISSIHTAIINVPNHEIDNKSPLPFAFDNFSTLGVRGNIASVGAAPPETPYPPIFPAIKRTPSPTMKRG